MNKNINYGVRYSNSADYFSLNGSVNMQLMPAAAVEVCRLAASQGHLVIRVEGGIWHNPGFEARVDCIWDSKINPPVTRDQAEASNALAVEDILRESGENGIHDVFILTSIPFDRPYQF